MSTHGAEVKGAVLRGVLRDAKDLPGGIARLMDGVPQEIRAACFASNIFHGQWYGYEALAALLDAYAKLPAHGSAAAFRELGTRMAERDFTTLLKAYALVASPLRLADVPRRIWIQRFRNAGESSSVPGDRWFRFTISGFPGIHPMQCELLTGYGQTVGRQKTGAFTNLHDRCVHRGDSDCSWLSSW